jgi:MFS family permease
MMSDKNEGMEINGAPFDIGIRLVIFLGGILAALGLIAINSVLPEISAKLAHGATDELLVKQLVGGVGLAMIFGAAFSGFLVSVLGLRRMLIISSICYVVAGTAGLYVSDLRLLLATRLLLGLAAAAIQVTSLTLINTRLEGAMRAKWLGINISVAMFGTIVIYPIAGALGELGWRAPFGIYLLGILLVPAALRIKERNSIDSGKPIPKSGRETSVFKWFPVRFIFLALCIGTMTFLPTTYAPFLLASTGVTSSLVISLVMTADSIAGAGMALVYGRSRQRFSSHAAFAVSFSACAVGSLVVAVSHQFVGTFIGLFIYGFGSGWLVANMLASLAEKLAPARQARAVGLVKAAHFAAAPLSVGLAEFANRQTGPAGVMLGVSILAVTLLVGLGLRTIWQRRAADRRALALQTNPQLS